MPRTGYTLVEILVSVTLMLLLMLAVTQLFRYVGETVTSGQNELKIAEKLRGVQNLLEQDLANVSVPANPPRRMADNEGYLCIIEGRGGSYMNLVEQGVDFWNADKVALNPDTGGYDSTIQDVDDILMFTVRTNDENMKYRGLVGGLPGESQEAEICWFVRGNTLYRRVLLIVPQQNQNLQNWLVNHRSDSANPYGPALGFYKDNDVSIHLDGENVVANTLGDLTRRENRYGHWATDFRTNTKNVFPYSLYNDSAWYWLRLPTQADCTADAVTSVAGNERYYWLAGQPLYSDYWATGSRYAVSDALTNLMQLEAAQENDPNNRVRVTCRQLPNRDYKPFIDFWQKPFPWEYNHPNKGWIPSLIQSTGALIYSPESDAYPNKLEGLDIHNLKSGNFLLNRIYSGALAIPPTNFANPNPRTEDVVLTNVIGFDVQVWDPELNAYTDLWDPTKAAVKRTALNSPGYYWDNRYFANMPAVYDTWTDAYEQDPHMSKFGIGIGDNATRDWDNNTNFIEGGFYEGVFYDNKDKTVKDSSQFLKYVDRWVYPPPYNVPLRGIQVKIRIMDPNTQNIKEVTVKANFKI